MFEMQLQDISTMEGSNLRMQAIYTGISKMQLQYLTKRNSDYFNDDE